jgi:starch synthase
MTGLMQAVDYSLWNPLNDEEIVNTYFPDDLSGKFDCKVHLISSLGISNNGTDLALIGMVYRIDHQKGIELIIKVLPKLNNLKIHIIVVGTGNKNFENKLRLLNDQLSYFTFIRGFNNQLAHEVEAGSDFFLMPSKFEPCGLNQLYSLKYGTIPIVRKTGGLADSIIDLEENPDIGNGFTFEKFDANQLENTIRRAIKFYHANKGSDKYLQLLKKIMKLDFSWNNSALKYKKLYEDLL